MNNLKPHNHQKGSLLIYHPRPLVYKKCSLVETISQTNVVASVLFDDGTKDWVYIQNLFSFEDINPHLTKVEQCYNNLKNLQTIGADKMKTQKYQKIPVTIEAFQWNGEESIECLPQWASEKILDFTKTNKKTYLNIKTLEGIITASVGDYIIKGVKGEVYPCKPDIFEITYTKNTNEI